MPSLSEPIRNLAYRLYTLCERKGWAEDARAYNELITSWDADRWNVGIIYSAKVWQVFRTFK
jgi:adenine-specific DNA methylase